MDGDGVADVVYTDQPFTPCLVSGEEGGGTNLQP
ncbi:MAG: hypothetical protein KDA27_27285 [Candidatus Eisenbacteria bacterium]|uniref:Uncharacterized protein n=1 Tax=Eiseniibacteriota bacterium TaxID=2212470 RepID=A0A956SHD6_UNCEI|nr:hypothetical protein [Candidatus Eisenbacteria bacterium]